GRGGLRPADGDRAGDGTGPAAPAARSAGDRQDHGAARTGPGVAGPGARGRRAGAGTGRGRGARPACGGGGGTGGGGRAAGRAEEDDDEPRRWRLLLLEDCDELIRGEAKRSTGQSLSRLLNLTDGLLGQGRDVLVAITTNEDVARLHPAVVRPGRCLARIA